MIVALVFFLRLLFASRFPLETILIWLRVRGRGRQMKEVCFI
jgi:hypothetical protein